MLSIWETLMRNQAGDILFDSLVAPVISEESSKLFNHKQPNILELSNSMKWWNLLPVYEKTSDEEFFESIRRGYFNINMYLRNEEELEYLPLRDFFHDTFGHLPILQN